MSKKFHSASLMAEGTLNTALFISTSQRIPSVWVTEEYGENRRQLPDGAEVSIVWVGSESGMPATANTSSGI
ncbi:MAG TPA: hypothetical protein VN692_20170 [Steroidobacteraceae bacterium]|nr:hypothetical protein [Steroidobacteraceae bacterium]